MKKQFLLAAAAILHIQSIAQLKQTTLGAASKIFETLPSKQIKLESIQSEKNKWRNATAQKGTANSSRWYNYVDQMSLIDNSINNNSLRSWIWPKNDIKSTYGNAIDTIILRSYATALDPSTTLFNTPALYPGEMAIQANSAFSVDSAIVYGFYKRKTGSVDIDTLRVSFVYGYGTNTNMPINYFLNQQSFYNTDTLFISQLFHDSTKNTIVKYQNSNTNVIVIDKLLTSSNLADTMANGLGYFKFAIPNFNIPANGIVGMSVSFKYGGTYTPYSLLYANGNYNYNGFAGLWYEQNANGLPTYTKRDFNTGYLDLSNLPSNDAWYNQYIPIWAYTAPSLAFEFPYIDLHLNCSTCNTTGVVALQSAIKSVVAAPNPANNQITISFSTTENSLSKVSISNLLGQEMETKSIYSDANSKAIAEFNTASFSAGTYIYTITTNGQSISNRFVINH